jgi:hypothetical protein
MPVYEIEISQTLKHHCLLTIEAANEEEAREKAENRDNYDLGINFLGESDLLDESIESITLIQD